MARGIGGGVKNGTIDLLSARVRIRHIAREAGMR